MPSARTKGEASLESCRIESARLAYRVFGDEPVSVVVETALNSCNAEWWDFCERLPGVSALVYDRAGYGTSSPSSLPRTPENVVRELEELLERVGSAERITLIGHSQGGLYAALFALRNPKKVKGVVLLDPLSFTDNDFRSRLSKDEFRASGVDKTSALRVGGLVTRFGLGFLFRSMLKKAPPFYYHRYRKDAEDYILSSLMKHEQYRTAIAEYSLAHQDGHLEVFQNKQNSLAIPFVVIVHSSEKMIREIEYYGHTSSQLASKIESVWQEVMRAMAQFSSESRIVVAENSSHYIHLTDGEMVAGIVGGIA